LESNAPKAMLPKDGVAERGVKDNRSEFEHQDSRIRKT